MHKALVVHFLPWLLWCWVHPILLHPLPTRFYAYLFYSFLRGMEGDLAGFEVVLALFCACTVRVIGQLFFYLWLTLISRLLPPSAHILSLCYLFIHLRHPTPYTRDIRFYDNTTRLLLTTSIQTRIQVRWRPQVHVPRGRHDRPI